ncbi:type IIL restriction-modification enzyme MmeI [Actinocrispum sp. NPDC049592]|uniref:Eco57I restriction-modification methylase domain-containing protein n=1 Tax=Actinocrispum sp. NPDC049592 TaxID=3154835 RepID=UPI00343FB899
MGAAAYSRERRRIGASDSVQQHRDWLSLIDVEGPFLALPVLRTVWPTLDSLDKPARQALRIAHTQWQSAPDNYQSAWLNFVLRELVGWGDELAWNDNDVLANFSLEVAEHDTRLTPSFVLISPGGDVKPTSTHVLGMTITPGVHPTKRIPGDTWAASPADRVARLCRHHGIQLGLVTDGRLWTLVRAPRNGVTTTATFDAIGWPDSAERLVVRAFISLLGRHRFFAVPDDEKLVALLESSKSTQEDLTEALGVQVRQAVELLVAAIGRADTVQRQRGEDGLVHVDAAEIYRGAVSTMMRIVFLLFAEERGLLPADNELYATAYSAGRLCAELERQALETSEDDLEHSYAAWHRLLALFEAVYYGVDHHRLSMYPHDGSLFDTTTYPWFPRTIDDRTVLHILRAVQYVETGTGKSRERRKLSFRELNVEQIGYVYEGLLAYDGFRAEEVTVGLIGKEGAEAEVPLRELEDLAARSPNMSALAHSLAEKYKSSGIGSAGSLTKKLNGFTAVSRLEVHKNLLSTVRGDVSLADRLLPFFQLIRHDLRQLPFVILPGELFVTESPLRKNTGTHYTPRQLAEQVVVRALEPLVYSPGPLQTSNRSKWQLKKPNEILALKVADVAMGSGAFLVSAAHYLADRLVESWIYDGDEAALLSQISRVTGEVDDDPVVIRARRQVIERCLYGVDINPAAVEITKVSLWLISLDPELPFTFLDDRLKAGDSLLGITSEEQLWHMHLDPIRGQTIHSDLFQWTAPGQALLEKLADDRLRITEISVDVDPLAGLAEKRKLLAEIEQNVAQLRMVADLLTGSALANAAYGVRGLDHGSVTAAKFATDATRDGLVEPASRKARQWLQTDQPSEWFERRPFHWPLEFPEVFRHGGFDGVIGNWPYLGGQKLTGTLGTAYREYLVHGLADGVRGSADLIAYFVLRAAKLVRQDGAIGLVATNTLAQGDTRQVGLDQLLAGGIIIYDAIKTMPWPSKSAALECCVVWATPLKVLTGRGMTASLDPPARVSGTAERLDANRGVAFIGSYVLGLGFTMHPDEAEALINNNPRNTDVLFSYLNGQDLNSHPNFAPSRWVINFHDWPLERAKRYPECYDQVVRLVKPERDHNNRKARRDRWWQYAERAPQMLRAVANLQRIIVITRVSKTVIPAMVPAGQVISEAVVVFATEDTAVLSFLSSSVHYWWVKSRASSMKADLRYTPSDVFETLPLPPLNDELRQLGQELDSYRRQVMDGRQAGLTKTYNLVFDPHCSDSDIAVLRRIHRDIDEATIRAYGWQERIDAVGGLDHGFHLAGRETRYTIGPAAQRELLDSLLELNHERYADEVARGLHIKSRRTGKRQSEVQEELELGLDDTNE